MKKFNKQQQAWLEEHFDFKIYEDGSVHVIFEGAAIDQITNAKSKGFTETRCLISHEPIGTITGDVAILTGDVELVGGNVGEVRGTITGEICDENGLGCKYINE